MPEFLQRRAAEHDAIKQCPSCGCAVPWGDMIWLDGQATCQTCYERKVRQLKKKEGSTR